METKPVVTSRAAWAAWLPMVALFCQNMGWSDGVYGNFESAVNYGALAAGAVLWLLHHFFPDVRIPTFRQGAGSLGLVLILVLPTSYMLTGCGGWKLPAAGDGPTMTLERCRAFVAVASVAIIECDRKTDELDHARCLAYANAAIAAANEWCAGYPSELEELEEMLPEEPAPAEPEPAPDPVAVT